ncbi:MAG: glycosyltransferase family 4 protein [Eubacterium sp.]|nr:glycosyltransferase family 4 protein [Eubacterium sp.]
MKIAFEAQLLLGEERTGIAWNAHNLILELAKSPENECVLQYFKSRRAALPAGALKEYQKAGCRIECCQWFRYTLYKLLWAWLPVPYRLFFHTKPDVSQFFNFAVPPGVQGNRIVFVHDMAYKTCPHTVDKKTRAWLELCMKKSCRNASHIVTVSKFSKREIMRYLHVPEKKITVIPNAVDHAVYHPGYTKKQIQNAKDRYGIKADYFLYLGTIEPRKNLERLLEAYARLYREQPDAPQLVLAGRRGWLCEGIYEKAKSLRLGEKVLFTGYVRQEDSPALLCGATAFVFPSLYEGFGMPPLEAMACKTPVITSNTTSLPEVTGDAAILVNPKSRTCLYRAMKKIIEDSGAREKYGELGAARAKQYTWGKSARMLLDVYRAAGAGR